CFGFGVAAYAGWGDLTPAVCKNDMGVTDGFKAVNGLLYTSYVESQTVLGEVLIALGKKGEGEKVLAQIKDLKEEKAPKGSDLTKAIGSSDASLNAALKEADATKLTDEAKSHIKTARLAEFKSIINILAASIVAAPLTLAAKNAIDSDKTCATKLTPVVDTVKTIVPLADNLQKSSKAFDAFAKTAGLPPLTDDEKKKCFNDLKVADDVKSKISL
ncbi:MAG: hypothetical protein NTZ48_05910, partial [Candidatus Omnitrophica bacterium]|nr:hypothetical protein [Candidatus Omnitrophota bacterium]